MSGPGKCPVKRTETVGQPARSLIEPARSAILGLEQVSLGRVAGPGTARRAFCKPSRNRCSPMTARNWTTARSASGIRSVPRPGAGLRCPGTAGPRPAVPITGQLAAAGQVRGQARRRPGRWRQGPPGRRAAAAQVDNHQAGEHVGQGHHHQGRDPGGRAGDLVRGREPGDRRARAVARGDGEGQPGADAADPHAGGQHRARPAADRRRPAAAGWPARRWRPSPRRPPRPPPPAPGRCRRPHRVQEQDRGGGYREHWDRQRPRIERVLADLADDQEDEACADQVRGDVVHALGVLPDAGPRRRPAGGSPG